jgi:hypothetical protein
MADDVRLCATCDSPDNLQDSYGSGGLNDVCLGCFYIWYDGPTERSWDEKRRRVVVSGESMRRASLLAKVASEWPYDGGKRVKEIHRALKTLGFASFGTLCDMDALCDGYKPMGSGYWASGLGEDLRLGISYAHDAIATEARRAETAKTGSVHEGAGPKDIAQ